jgi:hypothetical protein
MVIASNWHRTEESQVYISHSSNTRLRRNPSPMTSWFDLHLPPAPFHNVLKGVRHQGDGDDQLTSGHEMCNCIEWTMTRCISRAFRPTSKWATNLRAVNLRSRNGLSSVIILDLLLLMRRLGEKLLVDAFYGWLSKTLSAHTRDDLTRNCQLETVNGFANLL